MQRRFTLRRAWAPLPDAEREALAPPALRAAGTAADNRLRDTLADRPLRHSSEGDGEPDPVVPLGVV
jgi:hypothetical protein